MLKKHNILIFNRDLLTAKKIKIAPIVLIFLCINTLAVITGFVSSKFIYSDVSYLTAEQKIRIINDLDQFSIDHYKRALQDYRIYYPRVVYAQAIIESQHFKSVVFRENNNSLGMKCAFSRPTNNKGENRNHAIYNSWRDGLIDYALWQAYHIKNIHSEKEYIEFLGSIYAEDSSYVKKLYQNLNAYDQK